MIYGISQALIEEIDYFKYYVITIIMSLFIISLPNIIYLFHL